MMFSRNLTGMTCRVEIRSAFTGPSPAAASSSIARIAYSALAETRTGEVCPHRARGAGRAGGAAPDDAEAGSARQVVQDRGDEALELRDRARVGVRVVGAADLLLVGEEAPLALLHGRLGACATQLLRRRDDD